MKKVMEKISASLKWMKEKWFTKHEVEHSEQYHNTMQFLNKYSVLFHVLLAGLIVFLVELASRKDFISAAKFVINTPMVFFYNSFIVFASLLLVYLFRRRAFSRVLIGSFWVILGIINGIVLANRVTPFGAADLLVLSDLFSMTSIYLTPTLVTFIIVGSSLFIFLCSILYIKGPRFEKKPHYFISSVAIILVFFVAIPNVTRAAQSRDIVASYFTNIAQGYEDYGFVYSFSAGLVDWGMDEPETYNEEIINALMAAVESEKQITTVTSENGPNIITVLLESFVDPNEYNFMTYSKDPTPFFHYLEDNFTSGYMISPVVGAGTANAEFEVLTGMKLSYFGTGEYPYKTVLKEVPSCESVASVVASLGYGTHAVHNNGGDFYSRQNAFSIMGFDTFTSKELMDITEFTPTGNWAEDSLLAEETIKTLLSTPDQPDLTYTITVGQHGTYPEDAILEEPYCEVYGLETEELTNQWTYYMHQANKTDQFMEELVSMLEELDEDTIVIFWGDHLPTFGLSDEKMVSGDIFKTKYVTWNNFGLEENDHDIYAYRLMSEVFDWVGIHEGTMFSYHQTQSDNIDQEAYLNGIEQLQYDILYGERYCYGGEDKYPATDIVMGIDEVIIHSMYPSIEEGKVVLEGEGFTLWSHVYVNGEKTPTSYVSWNILTIDIDDIKNGDTIVVNQNGTNNNIFRSSNEWIYDETSLPTGDYELDPYVINEDDTETTE